MESGKLTIFNGNDFCKKVGFMQDKQGLGDYHHRELEAVELPT